MGRLSELIAKGSGKYYDWKNKRENERPMREARRKEKRAKYLSGLRERTELINTKNKLLEARSRSLSIKKQRLRGTLGFFTGIRTPERTIVRRRVSRRMRNPRRRTSYRVVYRNQSQPPRPPMDSGRMWFE